MTAPSHPGPVFLVGAGPGDPSLLTLRAKELLETADVILYDKIMSHAVLDHANPNAKQIFVGKQASNHALPQQEISALLVKFAQEGLRVVRLKGGDPLVFGRGGEEASTLREHNIPFQFVPGVSSAIAVPEYAGIPVTDRRYAQSFAVITGHTAQGESQPPWSQATFGADTLQHNALLRELSKISPCSRASTTPKHQPYLWLETLFCCERSLLGEKNYRWQENEFLSRAHNIKPLK
jgi:uroporphyrin-III C-methyltransferase